MPVSEGMEFLNYVVEQEQDEILTRRWLAPIYSEQSRRSFADFKQEYVSTGGGKTESAGEILDRVERMMSGRVVDVNGIV